MTNFILLSFYFDLFTMNFACCCYCFLLFVLPIYKLCVPCFLVSIYATFWLFVTCSNRDSFNIPYLFKQNEYLIYFCNQTKWGETICSLFVQTFSAPYCLTISKFHSWRAYPICIPSNNIISEDNTKHELLMEGIIM